MTCFDFEEHCSFQENYKYGVSEGRATVRVEIMLRMLNAGILLEDAIAILDDLDCLDGLIDKAKE